MADPGAHRPWELVLDHDTTLFHTQGPKRRAGQVRVPVHPERRPFTEVLTWSFPEVGSGGVTLAMQWDTVYVPLRLRVAPSYTTAVAREAAAPVAGRYGVHFTFAAPPGPRDTTLTAEEAPARDVAFDVRYEGAELRVRMTPPLFQQEPGYADWVLVPRRAGYYGLGRVQGGELVEIPDFVTLSFPTAGGRATSVEFRTADDTRMGVGARLP